jgi:AcrR family transcriptional regulator
MSSYTTTLTQCLDFVSMYVSRRRPQRSQATREKIVGAVRDLLAEGTFHESTVEEVAARAGVSRATLYQHFGTRLGLVDALCESFDANPALIAVRQAAGVDEFIELCVTFWSSEEKVLDQLYGAAAVDPAAAALVERQRRDRHGELRRLLRSLCRDDRRTFARLSVLTSFETYRELRRGVSLPLREVVATLQAAATA